MHAYTHTWPRPRLSDLFNVRAFQHAPLKSYEQGLGTRLYTYSYIRVQYTYMYTCTPVVHTFSHSCAHSLHSEAVPPDIYRKKPMCMSQYDMYSKCRIPYPGVDSVRHTPISESKHIVVIRNGHVRNVNFFNINVHVHVHVYCYTCTRSFSGWMFFMSVQMGLWLLPPPLILLNSYITLSRCPLTPLSIQLVYWRLTTGTLGPRAGRDW